MQANVVIPLASAAGYLALLWLLARRRGQREAPQLWLLAFLSLSALWELLAVANAAAAAVPNLLAWLLLAGTLLLGMATATYTGWERRRWWLVAAGLSLLAAAAVEALLPQSRLAGLDRLRLQPSAGGLALLLVWLGLSASLLGSTVALYRRTGFSWHANRLLFWLVALAAVFVGEALRLYNHPASEAAGHGVRLLGATGLAYGVASHRLLDIQARARRTLALTILVLVSTLVVASTLFLTQWLTRGLPGSTTTFAVLLLIAVGFLIYPTFRRAVEGVLEPLLLGESFDPARVVRSYSQAISRTLDVEQLSLISVGTLSELFETSRGALMLLSIAGDDVELEPIPAMGRLARRKATFPGNSLFINALAARRQPLLQYELDFDPAFKGLTAGERVWLAEIAMEVYVPIATESRLEGLIALGPKPSGLTFRPAELELAQTLADQTVVALENARLYGELGAQNERIRLLNADLRRQNERLEIMDRVKSDFITIASHELRTPLTQVKGYADILQSMNEENGLTREQTREIVGHINRASSQLERLIAAMLDASQLDVSGLKLVFLPTTLEAVIGMALEPLARAIRDRRLSLRLDGIEALPAIQADFRRLVQALSNLFSNAVKYTPDGGAIGVSASLVPSQDGRDFVQIVIADTGIGIDARFHELVFAKFFRVDDPQLHSTGATKFKGAGPGLGLPIARGVIEAHGGRIWVESEGEDEQRLPGSRFIVVLPVCPPGAEAVEAAAESRPSYLNAP